MKAKNITIDDLALMVSKGFAGMDNRFAGMDNRFAGMDKRFDSMDKRFDSIEDRLGNLEKGFEEMKAELFFIRAELSKRVDKFSHKDLELRLEKLEAKFKKYEKFLASKV